MIVIGNYYIITVKFTFDSGMRLFSKVLLKTSSFSFLSFSPNGLFLRLDFSLKDDEKRNQITLDLAVYR